jgi:hypothetical protein
LFILNHQMSVDNSQLFMINLHSIISFIILLIKNYQLFLIILHFFIIMNEVMCYFMLGFLLGFILYFIYLLLLITFEYLFIVNID